MNKIEKFIESIRNSFEDSIKVYTQGSCYEFYLILKQVFPKAIAYYNEDHVITRIGNKYYDITGEVKKEKHLILDEDAKKRIKFRM